MRFKEKVVFITGGTKGLGRAMAKAFLEEGAYVGVNGRNKEAVIKFEDKFRGNMSLHSTPILHIMKRWRTL